MYKWISGNRNPPLNNGYTGLLKASYYVPHWQGNGQYSDITEIHYSFHDHTGWCNGGNTLDLYLVGTQFES